MVYLGASLLVSLLTQESASIQIRAWMQGASELRLPGKVIG